MRCNKLLLICAGVALLPPGVLGFEPAELIESLTFLKRCEATGIPATLLLPEIRHAQEIVHPAVAYARSDGVFLHVLSGPDAQLSSNPADLADDANRSRWHRDHLRRERTMTACHGMLIDAAMVRLKQAGIRAARVLQPTDHLVIEYQGLQFQWSPKIGSIYNGLAAPVRLHPFLDGILLAAERPATNAAKQVRVYLRPDGVERLGITATTLCFSAGSVVLHDPRVGELQLPVPVASSRNELLRAADTALLAALETARQRRCTPPKKQAVADEDVTPAAMFSRLQRAGIDARMLRGTVIFRWNNRQYSYDGRRCFAVQPKSP